MYVGELAGIIEEHGIEAAVEAAIDMLSDRDSDAAEQYLTALEESEGIDRYERDDLLWSMLDEVEKQIGDALRDARWRRHGW